MDNRPLNQSDMPNTKFEMMLYLITDTTKGDIVLTNSSYQITSGEQPAIIINRGFITTAGYFPLGAFKGYFALQKDCTIRQVPAKLWQSIWDYLQMSSKSYRILKRSIKSLTATEYSKRTGKKDWTYVRLELWCAFLDTFVYSWLTPIVVFFESCRRTFKWFPIIWKDRDWDYNHLFQMMQAKLRFMRECLTEHGNEVWKSRQRKIRQLRTCEALLDRMTKHEYNDKLMAQHREKWYKGMNFFERLNQPQNEEETKEFLKLMDYEEYMYQQDLELFCEIFKKYHKGWWD